MQYKLLGFQFDNGQVIATFKVTTTENTYGTLWVIADSRCNMVTTETKDVEAYSAEIAEYVKSLWN